MTREKFVVMLNILREQYNPKNIFHTDDYYNQVKFLSDSILPKLRARIIEKYEYFPKPAELRKLAKEFDSVSSNQKNSSTTDGDKCFCGKPVFDNDIDPYRCKSCYEEHQEYLKNGI